MRFSGDGPDKPWLLLWWFKSDLPRTPLDLQRVRSHQGSKVDKSPKGVASSSIQQLPRWISFKDQQELMRFHIKDDDDVNKFWSELSLQARPED
ncbi:hypothetical protein L1987_43327 [Smallanthus sonchifolius]|uniref:Uncharacterized protein n=1 Tax=Smallanthus sonchifolius TaxID=185202 RepID=A0ACB9GLF5_9ASTR|nr:hypothetical protein L1987_43327 [Smallanthus sonchifolius]